MKRKFKNSENREPLKIANHRREKGEKYIHNWDTEMAGVMPQQFTVPFPVPVPAPTTTTSNPNPHDASSLNLLRVAMVMERFKVCLQDATNFNPAEFCGLCLYLARLIFFLMLHFFLLKWSEQILLFYLVIIMVTKITIYDLSISLIPLIFG